MTATWRSSWSVSTSARSSSRFFISSPADTNQNFINVTFSDAASQSINTAPGPYTNGTYQPSNPLSQLDGVPLNGDYTLYVYDFQPGNTGVLNSWSMTINSVTYGTTLQDGAPMDQNADATPDQNPLTTPFTGLTPGDLYVAPMPAPSSPFTFNASNILTPPFDQNTLPLIMPGPYVTNTSVPDGHGQRQPGAQRHGQLDERDVRPAHAGQQLQPQRRAPDHGPDRLDLRAAVLPRPASSVNQPIPNATSTTGPGTLDSLLTVPDFGGTFNVGKVTVQLNINASTDSKSKCVPDRSRRHDTVTLFQNVGGTGQNFTNTILDDAALYSITQGTAPFTGPFKPMGSLAASNTKNVSGQWTLHLVNSGTGGPATLLSWSISVTPVITITPVSPSDGFATQFTIGFPVQDLSGTYTVQLGPNILDAFGQQLDTSLNAGLAVLRGTEPNAPVAHEQVHRAILAQGDSGSHGGERARSRSDRTQPSKVVMQSTIYVPGQLHCPGRRAPPRTSAECWFSST